MDRETAQSQEFRDALFENLFLGSLEPLISLDARGSIATCSPGACVLLGYEPGELEGTPLAELLPKAAREQGIALLETLADGARLRNLEWRLLRKDGEEMAVRVTISRKGPARLLWAQRQAGTAVAWKLDDPALRDTMLRLQQLGAIGQLSAALAHQIRTPLHVIQSTVELLQDELPSGSPHQESLRVVNRNVERIAALTEALRGFVQQRKHVNFPGDLNKVVEQVCLFIEMLCKKRGIKLRTSLATLPLVRLDPDYLLGALYNLMANAVDAMPEGGVLTVVTAVHGREVTLAIEDTGRGMPPAVLEQIGRPFFTTKPQGTGLGVMVARQILEQHHATLRIESKPEVGTRVHIAFAAA